MRLGVLHPGMMGAVVAGEANGAVSWAGNGRSEETRRRADDHGLRDVGSIADLVAASDVVLSVCPPHAAIDVADEVAELGFGGIYVDANAISPERAMEVGERFERFVDGGLIGPPPSKPGTTRLYLAGPEASTVAAIWEGSALDTRELDAQPGSASALKMAYAGWTKGSAALLLAMRAFAESSGVAGPLLDEWALSIPDLGDRVERMAALNGPKAWRFIGEMGEIAASLDAVDLPSGFHEAAGEIYRRMIDLKGTDAPSVADVLDRLTG